MPEPFYIGQTVWNKKREDFGKIVAFTSDPSIALLDTDGVFEEVPVDNLEKSIFYEHNKKPLREVL